MYLHSTLLGEGGGGGGGGVCVYSHTAVLGEGEVCVGMRLQVSNASFQINRNFQQLPRLAQLSFSQVVIDYSLVY